MSDKKNERRDMLIRIAEMYYLEQMSQNAIAKVMNFSRSNISRLLNVCVDEKIVEFKINKATSRIVELEKEIKERYGLYHVRIVPSYEDEISSRKEVGRVISEYVLETIKDGMKIGMSWGSTLFNVVEAFETEMALKENLSVFQMLGGIGTGNINADGPQLTKMLSEKIGALPHVLNAPLVVQSKVLRDLLLEEPQIQSHYQKMENMDMLLMGIGSVSIENNAMYKAGYISLEEANDVITMGGVGDIAGHSVDAKGQICQTSISKKIISMDIHQLKNAAVRIGVAVGHSKIASVKAVLKGGYINVIAMDEVIAKAL